ncbi:hypothetical protein HK105_208059 [Polyrhizophydium stewartii]|uniref:PLAC8 family protein n=1 Tax=Polyrhizophydium stewartii TaxID=2732419 RepID=A0ABR4MYX6_9FUNG
MASPTSYADKNYPELSGASDLSQQTQLSPQPAMQTLPLSEPGVRRRRRAVVLAWCPSGPARDWSHGLFSCFSDLPTCLLGFVCPCVVFAQNRQKLNKTDSIVPDCLLMCCAVDCFVCGVVGCIGASGRGDIRAKAGISGQTATDCLAHWFCTSCALTQEKLELEHLAKNN